MPIIELIPTACEFRWSSDGGLKKWVPREVDVFLASRFPIEDDRLDAVLVAQWEAMEADQRHAGFEGQAFRTRRGWTISTGKSPVSGQMCNIYFNSISTILIPRTEVMLEVLSISESKKFLIEVRP